MFPHIFFTFAAVLHMFKAYFVAYFSLFCVYLLWPAPGLSGPILDDKFSTLNMCL